MELKFNFKNVGQGDTIFLEWQEDAQSSLKFGLIDCNLVKYGIEVVTKHIEARNITEFEFMIMTHPHSDHCSGFYFLFKYCEEKSIHIKQFIHTAPFDPTFLSTIVSGKIDREKLEELFTKPVNRTVHKNLLWNLFVTLKLQFDSKNKFIQESKILNSESAEIKLTESVYLKLLSPVSAYGELTTFFEKTYSASHEEKIKITKKCENNPHANYLSSVIRIYCKTQSWQVLLFSDVTAETLNRIITNKEFFREILNEKLLLIQIPHHGSKKNHVQEFWDKLGNLKDTKAIISVGKGYGHPDSPVISYFHNKCNEVHSTNYVGGFKKFFNRLYPSTPSVKGTSLFNLPYVGANISSEEPSNTNPSIPACGEKCVSIYFENDKCKCRISVPEVDVQ